MDEIRLERQLRTMTRCFVGQAKLDSVCPLLACPKSLDDWSHLYISTAWEQKVCWIGVRGPQRQGNQDEVDL